MAARIEPGTEGTAGQAPGRDLRLSLPMEKASAGRVRDALRDYLRGQRVTGDALEDVVLSADEACINAILHSGASGRLRVRAQLFDGRLRVEVRDTGCGFAASGRSAGDKPADPLALHGRGLYLIGQLMDDVHVESHAGVGTVVEMFKTL